MSPGAIFERVYHGLKQRILSGSLPPGAALEPAALAEDLVASITPVRDALHRLAGERLVHTPRGDGFRMPIYTEASLRDLYGWNARLLQLALAAPPSPSDAWTLAPALEEEPVAATERLFAYVAQLAGSHELSAAVEALNDRLHAVRRHETELIAFTEELEAMRSACLARDRPVLRRQVLAYHRRRIAHVPALLERLQPVL